MILNCLAQLHGRGIIHQDVKPSNFLFGSDGSIKLCDFNLSRMPSDSARANGGTLLYFSPQKFSNTDDGYAADWWALGVTIYQLLHGLQTWPFSRRSLHQISKLPPERQLLLIRKAVLKGRLRFRSLSGIPRAAKTLIRGLLHPQPEQRWGLVQVLAGDYPMDQAFSAVALRFPHLAPDMERLLALRRLCRAGPSQWKPFVSTFEEHGGADVREPQDAKTSARTNTLHSLRALSSCLLSRRRSYKCSAPMAAPPPAETDDLDPNDQLTSRCCANTAPEAAQPPPSAPPGVGFTAASAGGPPPLVPASRFGQPHASRADPEVTWSSSRGRCLPGSFAGSANASWRRALLLPRSDTAVRAAAARVLSPATRAGVAAQPPHSLLTPDGRLTALPFVPCEVRTHTLDLAAISEALAALNAAGASCEDSEQLRGLAAGGREPQASAAGQVQGVEVLEEMRVMLERRRLSAISSATSGAVANGPAPAGAPTGVRRPTDQLRPAASGGSGDAPAPSRPPCPTCPGNVPAGEQQRAHSPVVTAAVVAAADRISPGTSGEGEVCSQPAPHHREEAEVGPTARPSPSSRATSTVAASSCGVPALPSSASSVATAEGRSGCGWAAVKRWDTTGGVTASYAATAPAGSMLHQRGGAVPSTLGVESDLWPRHSVTGGEKRLEADAATGHCAGPGAEAEMAEQDPRRSVTHAADPQGSPAGTFRGGPSWFGGRPAYAATVVSPKGTHGAGCGQSPRREGPLRAGGRCSMLLQRNGGGDGSGDGLPQCRSSGSRRLLGQSSSHSSGNDAAGHADEAGSLFSLPFSARHLESGAAEAEPEADPPATGAEAVAAAAAAPPEAASAPGHPAPLIQEQYKREPVAGRGLLGGGATAVELPPAASLCGSVGACASPPLGAVGPEGLALVCKDERPTWGSAAPGAGAYGGGNGGSGGASGAGSGGCQGPRGVRAGTPGPCSSGGGPPCRGSNSSSPLSAASSSPAASSTSRRGGCPAGGPLAGCRSSGGGSRRAPSSLPEAGGRPGGKGRAQRARDAGGSTLAHSGAWGGTVSNRA